MEHTRQPQRQQLDAGPSRMPAACCKAELSESEKQQLLDAGVIGQPDEFVTLLPGDPHHSRALFNITWTWDVLNPANKKVTEAVYRAGAEQKQVIDYQQFGSKAAIMIAKPLDEDQQVDLLIQCLKKAPETRWQQDFLKKQLGWPIIRGNTVIVAHPNPQEWLVSEHSTVTDLPVLAIVATDEDPDISTLGAALPAFFKAMAAVHPIQKNVRKSYDFGTPIVLHGTRYTRFGGKIGQYVKRSCATQAKCQDLAARLREVAPGLAALEKKLLPQAAAVRYQVAVLSKMPADCGALGILSNGCQPISREDCPAFMTAASRGYISFPHMDESAGNVPETIVFNSGQLSASSSWCFSPAGARVVIQLAPDEGSPAKTTFVAVPAKVLHGTPFISKCDDESRDGQRIPMHTGVGVAICNKLNLVHDSRLPQLYEYWKQQSTEQLVDQEPILASNELSEFEYIEEEDASSPDEEPYNVVGNEQRQLPNEYHGTVLHEEKMQTSLDVESSLNLASDTESEWQEVCDSQQQQQKQQRQQWQSQQQQSLGEVEEQGLHDLQQQHQILDQRDLEQQRQIHVLLEMSPTQILNTHPEHMDVFENSLESSIVVGPDVAETAADELDSLKEGGDCQQQEPQEPASPPQQLSQHLVTPTQTGQQQVQSSISSGRTVTAVNGQAVQHPVARHTGNVVVTSAASDTPRRKSSRETKSLVERRIANVWKDYNEKARKSTAYSKRPAETADHLRKKGRR